MNLIINRIIMSLVFLLGIVCFSFYSIKQDFFIGIIFLSLALIFVNIYGVIAQALQPRSIFNIYSVSIVFIAISVFGNYGVEQKPIGYQTVYLFNLQGVAISLILFLLSSVTFILGKNQNKSTQIQVSPVKKSMTTMKPKNQNIIESDDWQEASIEDIQSGHYHIYNP
jgi:hypothetical protein